MEKLRFRLRSQVLAYDEHGSRCWRTEESEVSYEPHEVAVVIVDVWDRHWSTGATRRVEALAPRIDAAARRARKAGALIVHAPSDTMEFYADHPARLRAQALEPVLLPSVVDVPDVPQPVDTAGGGSDTMDEHPENTAVWRRQHEAIWIDEALDLVSDSGGEIYAHFAARGIKFVIYMGVHTNMCILGRSFAIKAMRRAGLQTALARDLTDAMFDPSRPPYVSHGEGTRLVVEYIEKFYCPTVDGLTSSHTGCFALPRFARLAAMITRARY